MDEHKVFTLHTTYWKDFIQIIIAFRCLQGISSNLEPIAILMGE